MQGELATMGLALDVQILGVNDKDHGSQNATISDGRDLPWLQEEEGQDIWDSWDVVYRDVILLDAKNMRIGTFNLTSQSLSDSENYTALKQMIVNAATP